MALIENVPIDKDLNVDLELGFITPKLVWDSRQEWTDFITQSKEIFDKMSSDQKEAAKRLVCTALERMYDNAEEWIPESLSTDGGDYMEARIRIIFTDIDKEVERFEEASSFALRQAKEDAAKMLGMENSAPDLSPVTVRGAIEKLNLGSDVQGQVLDALRLN